MRDYPRENGSYYLRSRGTTFIDVILALIVFGTMLGLIARLVMWLV